MSCQRCNEDGMIVVCPDDICRGQGECIHGDGMAVCPDCGGDPDGGDPYDEETP